jgi:hypothetical protein
MEVRRKMLEGYKTYIGGACFILGAVATVGKAFYNGTFADIDWNIIAVEVGTGISIIGGRAVLKENAKSN